MNSEGMRSSTQGGHRITMCDRSSMEICGVTDVISFDEETVVLETVCGRLTVDGASLHVHTLNVEAGLVTLEGRVDALAYETASVAEESQRGGFFSRLFR